MTVHSGGKRREVMALAFRAAGRTGQESGAREWAPKSEALSPSRRAPRRSPFANRRRLGLREMPISRNTT